MALLAIAGGAPPDQRAQLRIDAIKYGLGVIASGGALAALLLAVRRQRLAEQAHELAIRAQTLTLRAQEHTEYDSAARRITELYAKAVEQVGSDKAAVRLGGLYAMERLAQDNPELRATVAEVFCAYLRMPYRSAQPPLDSSATSTDDPGADVARPPTNDTESPNPREERQVRLTAQRVLTRHLHLNKTEIDGTTVPNPRFWTDVDIDLTEAYLIDWTMWDCTVGAARFAGATFAGRTRFVGATFNGNADFTGATFIDHDDPSFVRATFKGTAGFTRMTLPGIVFFSSATFLSDAHFDKVTVTNLQLDNATFVGNAHFYEATFRTITLAGATAPSRDDRRGDSWPRGWRVDQSGRLVFTEPRALPPQQPSEGRTPRHTPRQQ